MVSAAAVFAAVCGALLKRGQKEIALLFSLAAAVLVFLCILPQIETLTSTFREWAELSGMPEVFGALLKALGIVLIGRITADLCKDAGESAIASGVELAVKTAVLLTALSVLDGLGLYIPRLWAALPVLRGIIPGGLLLLALVL